MNTPIPEDIITARRHVAEQVSPESRWFYLIGKADSHGAVKACLAAIQAERERCAKAAHGWMHDNGLGANAADVGLVIMGHLK